MGHRVSKLQREELPTTDPFQSPTTPIPPATPKSSDPLSSSNPKSVIITICMLKVEQQPDHTDTLTMMPNATTGCDCWLTNNGPLTTHHSTHQRCTNAANASATIPIVHMSDITGEPNDDLNNANLISCCDNDKPPTFSATPTTVDPNDNANNNPPHIADQLAYYPVSVNQPTSDYQIMAKPDRDLHQHSTNANKDTTLNTGIPFDMISATNYKKTLSSLDTPTAGRASATATAMHENESFRPISHSQNLQQASLMEIAASFGNMSIDRSLMDKLEINESGDHCPACQDQQKTHRGANIKSPSTKRCCAKTHDPKEAKVKKTTNWKLNCAKLISGAKSSAMSSPTPSTATTASSLPAAPTIGRAANRKVDVEPSATTVGSADIPLEPQTPTAEPTPFWPTTLSAIDLREKATSKEDLDQVARIRRAHEIARGVDPPPGYMPMSEVLAAKTPDSTTNTQTGPMLAFASSVLMEMPNGSDIEDSSAKRPEQRTFHSQVDFIHCLVPDLKMITSSCFYWGKMDRYEAERLLDGKPEGTFLLRDSAQEDFLFSVSFRKYNRSLHARIEQFNHKFSFDCHDPAVATSSSVTGLLEKYKNPQLVMFFEPALTLPLTRNFVFPLQQLCRATIVSQTSYDGIGTLSLPATLKSYLKEYHYKQRVRVNCFE